MPKKYRLLVFGYIVIPTMLQFSQNHKIQLWCFEVTVNRTHECEKNTETDKFLVSNSDMKLIY